MLKNLCLKISGNNIEIAECDNYLNLILMVFNNGLVVKNYNRINFKKNINMVLEGLTVREERVCKLFFGILESDSSPKSCKEIAKEFNVTEERMKQILSKAIRKMKHPTRAKHFLQQENIYNYTYDITQAYESIDTEELDDLFNSELVEYTSVFEDIIKKEILLNIKGIIAPTLYLDQILEKNDIKIERLFNKFCYENIDIYDMNLNTRVCNVLYRNNIRCINDLIKKTPYELSQLRNLGQKGLNEILEKINSFSCSLDDYHTVKISNHGEVSLLKFHDDNLIEIANSIYQHIFYGENRVSVFRNDISPKLLNFLLMEGYIYYDDILKFSDEIIKNLGQMRFFECSEELEYLIKSNEITFIHPVSGSLFKFLKDNHITTVDELHNSLNRINDDKLLSVIQHIVEKCMI